MRYNGHLRSLTTKNVLKTVTNGTFVLEHPGRNVGKLSRYHFKSERKALASLVLKLMQKFRSRILGRTIDRKLSYLHNFFFPLCDSIYQLDIPHRHPCRVKDLNEFYNLFMVKIVFISLISCLKFKKKTLFSPFYSFFCI